MTSALVAAIVLVFALMTIPLCIVSLIGIADLPPRTPAAGCILPAIAINVFLAVSLAGAVYATGVLLYLWQTRREPEAMLTETGNFSSSVRLRDGQTHSWPRHRPFMLLNALVPEGFELEFKNNKDEVTVATGSICREEDSRIFIVWATLRKVDEGSGSTSDTVHPNPVFEYGDNLA